MTLPHNQGLVADFDEFSRQHVLVPCLLESLIQLISAERTKYKVFNNGWSRNGCCWEAAAENAVK